jgi:hypothetical protein
MKITTELLEHYNASLQFIDFIKNKYPSGLEFSELIRGGIVPVDLLHYIRQYCDLSEIEMNLYESYCNIKDSENIWYSQEVKNSKNLYLCDNVSNSSFVRNSDDVYDSTDVYNSSCIKNSKDVAHSTDIRNSRSIIESQSVNFSNNVARSNQITWSNNILNCSHLDDCSFNYMSNDLIDCHFCGFVNNSRRCLFCTGIEGEEYYIFNKEVSPAEYEEFKEVLLSKIEDETSKMIIIDSSKHLSEERFRLNRRFDSIFNGLTKEFYGWVGTAPNYSDDVFLNLFFRDRE